MAAANSSEAGLLLNRINIGRARSLRILQSWLPEANGDTTSSKELEQQDDEAFTPMPDHLGVGAPIPKEFEQGSLKLKQRSRDDELRKQLLGKSASKHGKDAAKYPKYSNHIPVKPMPKGTPTELKRRRDEDSSDEEEAGRASAFRSKRFKPSKSIDGDQNHSNFLAASNKNASAPTAYTNGHKSSDDGEESSEEQEAIDVPDPQENDKLPPSLAQPSAENVNGAPLLETAKKKKRKKKKKNRKKWQQQSQTTP